MAATSGNQIVRYWPSQPERPPVVVAGTKELGYRDGEAASAQFSGPDAMALADSGDVAVVDAGAQCIRVLRPLPAGGYDVELLAGVPFAAGFADGDATSATFHDPRKLAFGPDGHLYVADYGNSAIRRVELTAGRATRVTTVVGGPTRGRREGALRTAGISKPIGLVFLPDGRLLVADQSNGASQPAALFLVNPADTSDSAVRMIAGGFGGIGSADGPARVASFASLSDLMVDADGSVLLANGPQIKRLRFDQQGQGFVSTWIGSNRGFADGPGATAKGAAFTSLIALSPRVVLAVDVDNQVLRRIVRGD